MMRKLRPSCMGSASNGCCVQVQNQGGFRGRKLLDVAQNDCFLFAPCEQA
jgi:hypothetical protein